MKTRWGHLFLIGMLVLIFAPEPTKASALDTNKPLVLSDCSINDKLPCIKGISVLLKNGQILNAKLTGRRGGIDKEFAGSGYDEYEVPGINFEEPSGGRFINRSVFYPYSKETNCESNSITCGKQTEFLALGLQPSWLDRTDASLARVELKMPHRQTNLMCGQPENRTPCFRSNNFLIDLIFQMKIQVPNDFYPIWLSGSSQNVRVANWNLKESSSNEFSLLDVDFGTLERQMVLFSDYYPNPIAAIDASPYADYLADWPNVWINGSKDRSLGLVGKCRTTPYVSVFSNSIYQEIPFWNSTTNSIDIKLYASHYKTNGEINYGFYELNITKDLAKCFWGIDVTSKTQAKITIYYPDNSQSKVVETIETRLSGDIFTATATNFTYSNPTIKTQLVQPTPQATDLPKQERRIEISQSPSAQQKANRVVKISCVKGKITKTISGLNPKCPAGFKKK